MADEQLARLERIVEHAADLRSLLIRPTRPFAFQPGQFVSCLLAVDDSRLTRPYSIASAPEHPEELELLLNLVPNGPGSAHLFSLAPGADLTLTGPWGKFDLERQPAAETVFVADGTGIAPIRPMLARAVTTGRHAITLLHAAPPGTRHVYADEHVALAARTDRLDVALLASDDLEQVVVSRYVHADTDRTRHFFICGVGDTVVRLRQLLREAGYDRRAVRYEKW